MLGSGDGRLPRPPTFRTRLAPERKAEMALAHTAVALHVVPRIVAHLANEPGAGLAPELLIRKLLADAETAADAGAVVHRPQDDHYSHTLRRLREDVRRLAPGRGRLTRGWARAGRPRRRDRVAGAA